MNQINVVFILLAFFSAVLQVILVLLFYRNATKCIFKQITRVNSAVTAPVPTYPPPTSTVTIPFPSTEHNAPKGPEGNWRNYVKIETGSTWGKESCEPDCKVTTTTANPPKGGNF